MFARSFGDAPVLHSGWTGCFAGAAEQTEIKMLFEALVEFDAPFGGGLDQMNAPARRLRLEPQRAIGRALVQTETAVDALVELGEVQFVDF